MPSLSSSKMIMLMSSDYEICKIDEEVALKSWMIRQFIKDERVNNPLILRLPTIESKILKKVIKYCKKHVELERPINYDVMLDEELEITPLLFSKVVEDNKKSFDAKFMRFQYLDVLGLIEAAYDLKIRSKELYQQLLILKDKVNIPEEEEEEFLIKNTS
ncbi:SKP1-like protein 1B [Tanacetum coccineum]